MANHVGSEGVIKVGTNTVAEVTGFSITESAVTIDDSELSDAWETHQLGRKSWSGSISARWDETDTTGQGALVIGASITGNFYPEGATTGDKYYSGTCTITNVTRKSAIDSMVDVDFTVKGSGALTLSTAA